MPAYFTNKNYKVYNYITCNSHIISCRLGPSVLLSSSLSNPAIEKLKIFLYMHILINTYPTFTFLLSFPRSLFEIHTKIIFVTATYCSTVSEEICGSVTLYIGNHTRSLALYCFLMPCKWDHFASPWKP